jgi:hypothetical protein
MAADYVRVYERLQRKRVEGVRRAAGAKAETSLQA